MTSVSMDGQGFLASGRRIVVCSASVSFARLAPERWGATLDAVARAGFNAVEAPIVWREHEPREGAFDFKGGRDLAQFVREAGSRGLWVIVRVGIVAGEGWDFGGLPSWLNRHVAPEHLRSGAPEFLERLGKFVSKACGEFKGLQAAGETATEKACVLAVQAEHGYECGDEAMAVGYLAQVHRSVRESGVNVPVLNANNLYAYVDGQVETWRGGEDLLASMRQMRTIEPNEPLYVSHLPVGPVGVWGERAVAPTRAEFARRLCQALAAGSSFNVERASPGDRAGFTAGRTMRGFACTDTSAERLFDPDGRPNELATAARRVCLFASGFASLLGSATIGDEPACASVESPGATVVQRRSTLGTIVYVFADPTIKRGSRAVEILMRDGTRCAVDPGADGVGWALAGVSLGGRARLDLCTASAVALVGSVFVCCGAGGSDAEISINGSVRDIAVPKGKTPDVFTLEGITVVCVNEAHLGEVEFEDDSVVLHALKKRLASDGSAEKIKASASGGSSRAPSLGGWSVATAGGYLDGTADRFAVIQTPAPMEAIGVGEGYGWIRVKLKTASASRRKLSIPESSDRVHVYKDGGFAGIIGETPGAEDTGLALPLSKGEQVIGMLVDNLGRRSEGNMIGERKGVFGHLFETAALKSTCSTVECEHEEALRTRSPLFGVDRGELIDSRRVMWTFTHRKKSPVCVTVEGLAALALVYLNEKLLGVVDAHQRGRWTIDQETLNRGKNELIVGVVGDAGALMASMKKSVTLFECSRAVTDGAEWAYAKWEPPMASEFVEAPASAMKGRGSYKGSPAWWRCAFGAVDLSRAVRFDATGLSKGQVFINGKNAGRYWVSTPDGKSVEGSTLTHLPAGWLNEGGPNELLIFDEHGFAPGKCRVVYA